MDRSPASKAPESHQARHTIRNPEVMSVRAQLSRGVPECSNHPVPLVPATAPRGFVRTLSTCRPDGRTGAL